MVDVEAVASIPGGGEFVALWRQVAGDPGAIRAIGDVWQAHNAKVNETGTALRGLTHNVDGAWSGQASDSFCDYMGRYDAANHEMQTRLTSAQRALAEAAEAVQSAKDRLSSIANRILDGYRPAADSTAQDRQRLAGHIVPQAIAEAKPHVEQMLQSLQQAKSALRSAADTRPFEGLTPPDAQTYLPGRGKPIQWSPVVNDSTVSPSSAAAPAPSGATGGPAPVAAGGGASSGSAPSTPVSGDVKDWISQAQKILEENGVAADKLSADDIATIIQHESGGDPHAENGWDSNAAAGTPSKGLMQTIDPTFNSYALPGHTDIWNPVDSIIAGVRYALSRYGSLDNVPGIEAMHSGGSYVGY